MGFLCLQSESSVVAEIDFNCKNVISSTLGALDYPEADILVAERLVFPYLISILVKLNSIAAASIIHLARATLSLIFIHLMHKVMPILIGII